MSNFDFIRQGWPELAEQARRAEHYAVGDPRTSLFYARRALEAAVEWTFRADASLGPVYREDLNARLHDASFMHLAGPAVLDKMHVIRQRGNAAVHRDAPVTVRESEATVRELFHVFVWFASTFALTPDARPAAGLRFDAALVPCPRVSTAQTTRAETEQLAERLRVADDELARAEQANVALEAELEQLRAQVAAAKPVNVAHPVPHDFQEAQTRADLIDPLLRESGWLLDQARDREYPVMGLPDRDGGDTATGRADYVLWGADGKPLAVVEAKRASSDALVGQQQGRLYADALEREFSQRPVIYVTNGFETWLWDDLAYPQRRVQGFATRDELQWLVQRRQSQTPLTPPAIDSAIVDRLYQQQAITRVTEAFDAHQRRALLVMATGTGKTRTVVALADSLMRANRVKRVLFLADRVALVRQAARRFVEFLPDETVVNLVETKDVTGRVSVSTYQTMMGLIDQRDADGVRRFGPNHFDLIVVDEAHRSIYQKYRFLFDWFDALVVGLTATPKDDVDHDTYELFGLESGVPTDSYDLERAIDDGYLVPPVGRVVATRFTRQGIRYDDLSDDEKERWEEEDWGEEIPDAVDASAVNDWLFNRDTVDGVLKVLMAEGRTVGGGDTIGKTIVFARNQAHARFIEERFNASYPHFHGLLAQVVTYQTPNPGHFIDEFSNPDRMPQIAISVDMLDTGIDVPDVVNLVFFKPVGSKTKYWQMVGRGTRLRTELYGPNGQDTDGVSDRAGDKKDFVIFDVGGNIAYFNADVPEAPTSTTRSLRSRLFLARLRLLQGLDHQEARAGDEVQLRYDLAALLHGRVAGMTAANVLVRPHRRVVERFAQGREWASLDDDAVAAAVEVADLPSTADAADTDEDAKRFDLLALRAQLGVLEGAPGFASACARIMSIAKALSAQRNIPAVGAQGELLDQVVTPEWWDGVTVTQLEAMRRALRGLVQLAPRAEQRVVYTDLDDEVDVLDDIEIVLGAGTAIDRERFRAKTLAFLRAHENHLVLAKLRKGAPLTEQDVVSLETLLLESGEVDPAHLALAVEEAQGLGHFIRSVVGMDRAAVSDALSAFIAGTRFTGNQLAFVNLIVDRLTDHGRVSKALLYEPPFTAWAPTGPDDLFETAVVRDLFQVLDRIDASAEAG
ncbi:DEAD/DEAH box helicase family protein [Frigoribacterium sp. 2-23]|uniref:DEAD/DEAH box helicase family protein n=1 Tax=Frigoribacterium sp. 2-23 TaxID=3415006 RepID=UPI003C6F7886